MKRTNHARLAASAFTLMLVGCLLAAGMMTSASILPPEAPPGHTELERQGRHLLQIASGCGCHGPNFAGWRAGGADTLPRSLPYGERFVGPFGDVPAPNITADVETGIGGWTDDQIAQAITKGVTPYGTRLSPIMPYRAYAGMSQTDIHLLVAYLHRLRPVHNAVPLGDLKEPIPDAGSSAVPPETRPSDGVALGCYLVRNVSSCADCHATGQPGPAGEVLAGNMMHMGKETVSVPNLTPDRQTGIGTWSEDAIARYLRTGSRPDGGLAQSAMAGLILSSFSHFTPAEAHAVAAYLKSLPPVHHWP